MARAATPEPTQDDPRAGVDVVVSDGVGLVTVRNPRIRNALTRDMWAALVAAVEQLAADPSVAAIVLRGHGEHFSAGADIADLPEDPAELDAFLTRADETLATCTTPVIAAIDGVCVGGGCAIAVASHLRFASTRARFGITAGRLGVVYPPQPTRRLTELVGVSTARRILLGGEVLDADWALRVGLIDELVDASDEVDVVDRALEFAHMLGRRSGVSLRAALRLTAGLDATDGRDLVAGDDAAGHADYREGRAAFLAKRPPAFPSRATGAADE